MTLREITYDIREKLKLNTDDINITDEYLEHLINVNRIFLIKQRFSKHTRNIPEEIKQSICINLEPSNLIEGEACFGEILSSTVKIPPSIEIGGRNSIIAVRVKDILYPHLNIIPTERLPYVGYNKWLKNQLYIALDADNKLYLKSSNSQHMNLSSIKVIGVFSNPRIANELDCNKESNCEYEDTNYPIESYLVKEIVDLIVRELAPSLNIPEDNINNSDESNRN